MPGMRDVEIRKRSSEILILLAIILASIPLITGYLLLVLSSFSKTMFTNLDPNSFHPTLINWILLFQGRTAAFAGIHVNIWRIVLNTLIVALGISFLVTILGSLNGYAISRMNFPGRKHILALLILLHAFPGSVLVVGVYFIYRLFIPPLELVSIYSFFYVIVARAAVEIPMATWLMKGFFDMIPWEIEWSAIVDGASRFKVWWKILLPMIKPGLAAVMLFGFLAGWMDLIYVRTFLVDITLAKFIEANTYAEYAYLPLVAAAGTLYLLPTILFFIFAQKLIFTISVSGIKG
ncbi:binding-protein-dependent transport systems inner membrane component [Staphylothermus marinus F1]|uniref:Binding-protein-dependent transport systems inner membrane component n=1 Tax=Staphylothermus marinus (strain ATCC 43588 / DSM 3639 / JCM 9404 / F1) TaxID=399550 RepID=A3DKR3_STAMF|nr:carbohydrate ABC transporter permease [Staphylothermus marinus]ABN69223.1 binding-protein-dependent transport systems inner membrane component [Staphylothermus marinus F1]